MKILRRAFLNLLASAAFGQQVFRGWPWATFTIQTTKTTNYHPQMTKTGATLLWKWPDGTYTSSSSPTKTLAAGTKTVLAISRDGFRLVTVLNLASQNGIGLLPSMGQFTGLTTVAINVNVFSGTLPSFGACTGLTAFTSNDNAFSGVMPSFAPCTSLLTFTVGDQKTLGGGFTGALPSFAACTAMTSFSASTNLLTGVTAGSFATQKNLTFISLGVNAFSSAAVNQILADCVASLSISGRVACSVFTQGGTNGAPTGQGIIDKAALITAGWTVVTN